MISLEKVARGQWVQCPYTGEMGQAVWSPFLTDIGDGYETFVHVAFPDGLYAVRMVDLYI